MNDLTIVPRAKPAAPAYIVLDAVDVRPTRAPLRTISKVLALGRTALTVWGGISLAGLLAAAVAYAHGGISFDRHADVRAEAAVASVTAEATPIRTISADPPTLPKPRPNSDASIVVSAPLQSADPAASAAAAPTGHAAASSPAAPQAPTGASAAAAILAPPEDEDTPTVEARLPRPRPDEPVIAQSDEPTTTGSIAQHPYDDRDPVRWSKRRAVLYYYATRYRIPPL